MVLELAFQILRDSLRCTMQLKMVSGFVVVMLCKTFLIVLFTVFVSGNREFVDFLVKEGALIDADSADGSPLQIAVSHGNVEAVKALLSHGAKVSSTHYLLFANDSLVYIIVCFVLLLTVLFLVLLLTDFNWNAIS